VRFSPVVFTPKSLAAAPHPRFEGEPCRGVALSIVEPERFEALTTGLSAIETLRSLYPGSFRWVENGGKYWIDVLLGTDRLRLALDAGVPLEKILERERESIEEFIRDRKPYLLY
jgi:uncharacterized protein YbbC (DUF1343 family)